MFPGQEKPRLMAVMFKYTVLISAELLSKQCQLRLVVRKTFTLLQITSGRLSNNTVLNLNKHSLSGSNHPLHLRVKARQGRLNLNKGNKLSTILYLQKGLRQRLSVSIQRHQGLRLPLVNREACQVAVAAQEVAAEDID